MMKYFRLLDDMTSPNRWHLGVITCGDGAEPLLTGGIRHEKAWVLRTAIHHPGPPLDFCLTSFAVPVATAKLAHVVAKVAGDDVQCLRLHITDHPDRFVLNATRVIRCLDEHRTVFTKWTEKEGRSDRIGDYRNVRNLTVDPAIIPANAHFFRIERYLVPLIVSEAVKEAMERAGCTGADFRDVNPPHGG